MRIQNGFDPNIVINIDQSIKASSYKTFWPFFKQNLGTSVKAEEAEFAAVLKKRAEDGGGKIKVIDVAKKESEIEVTEMISLHDVIEDLKATKFPGLTHNRIPICNSASPLEGDFDALCTALIGTNVNCPVIVNCQVIKVILGWVGRSEMTPKN